MVDTRVAAPHAILVDLIAPRDDPGQSYLVLLIEFCVEGLQSVVIIEDDAAIQTEVAAIARAARHLLSERLPSFMIPVGYLGVSAFPHTASGKVDRKQICQSVSAQVTKKRLLNLPNHSHSEQTTSVARSVIAAELRTILGPEHVERSFVSLGGDSLGAIRLVNTLHLNGYHTTVNDLLRTPRLRHVLETLEGRQDVRDTGESPLEALSLLAPDTLPGDAIRAAASQCGTTADDIEDFLPCTPFQETLVLASMREKDVYWSSQRYRLKDEALAPRVPSAWATLCTLVPALRSRMILLQDHKIHQAILRNAPGCISDESTDSRSGSFALGTHTARCLLVQHRYVVVHAHHTVLDGWCLWRVMTAFENILRGDEPPPFSDFRLFVRYCRRVVADKSSRQWWQRYLEGAPTPHSFLDQQWSGMTRTSMAAEYHLIWPTKSDFTLTTYARTAFALLLSVYSNSTDVTFGAVSSGRAAPGVSFTDSSGPTMCVTPFRVRFGWASKTGQLLRHILETTSEMITVEHVGVQHISSWLRDSDKSSCHIRNILVVQPDDGALNGSCLELATLEQPMKLLHELNLEVTPLNDGRIGIQAHFDENAISLETVTRITRQLHSIMHNLMHLLLTASITKAVEASSDDKSIIYEYNRQVAPPHQHCIHYLIHRNLGIYHDQIAVDSRDGSWSYGELWAVAERIASGLSSWGVQLGESVVVVLEKSKWAVATMLAILMQGAHSVPVAADSPQAQFDGILEATRACYVLVAEEMLDRLCFNAKGIQTPQMLAQTSKDFEVADVSPLQTAFVMFSSGTTGSRRYCVIFRSETRSANSVCRS